MTYTGKVENGVIIIDGDTKPREGAVVRVEEMTPSEPVNADRRSVWEVLREFDGVVEGLPSDMAENHDHYIHGTRKGIDK